MRKASPDPAMIINIMIKMTDVDTDPLPTISSSPSAIKMRAKTVQLHPNIPIHKAEILKEKQMPRSKD